MKNPVFQPKYSTTVILFYKLYNDSGGLADKDDYKVEKLLVNKNLLEKILKKISHTGILKGLFFVKKWCFYSQKAIASYRIYGYGLGGFHLNNKFF